MPEHENLPELPEENKLVRWLQVHEIFEEVHSELDAQVKQHGDHLLPTDLPDNRDELVQLVARAVHTIWMLDRRREDPEASGG